MRRYDEPIAVRSGEIDGQDAPIQFLWRSRLWRVLGVQGRWRETAEWWELRPEDGDLLAESVVWRVLASPSRERDAGVYDLAHPVNGGEWLLRAVVD